MMDGTTLCKIYIRRSPSWGESRQRLIKFLGMHHSSDKPIVILNFNEDHEGDLDHPCIVLNLNVEIMRNKIIMNYLLDELKIPHPKTYYYPFKKMPKKRKECVVKKSHSEQGYGIRFTTFREFKKKKARQKISKDKFIQEFIPFEKEYRVVVDPFGVIGIKEKVGNSKIKNSKTCKFTKTENTKLAIFAEDVCQSFGVDFTGIDIGEYKGDYYVIEFNSAPSISTECAKIFANHLIKIGNFPDWYVRGVKNFI